MDELEFQDHPYESDDKKSADAPAEHTVEFSDFPPDATRDDEDEPPSNDVEGKPAPSVFSLAFYQQFFDVDTPEVGSRILWSMLPNPKRNVLEHVIRPKADLYGPFWVCATLTFCIAITGNVADFFETSGRGFKWVYDYHKVPLAATAIFGYWLVIPVGLWAILRWRGSLAGYTLTELICVYGYSLAIFIPCSILWLIPYIQYPLAIVCALLSGATLLITLYPAVKNDGKQVMIIFMVIIIVLHSLLATGFVMYFFRFDKSVSTVAPAVSNKVTAASHSEVITKKNVAVDPKAFKKNIADAAPLVDKTKTRPARTSASSLNQPTGSKVNKTKAMQHSESKVAEHSRNKVAKDSENKVTQDSGGGRVASSNNTKST